MNDENLNDRYQMFTPILADHVKRAERLRAIERRRVSPFEAWLNDVVDRSLDWIIRGLCVAVSVGGVLMAWHFFAR